MEFLCLDILNSNRGDWNHKKFPKDAIGEKDWAFRLAKKWKLDVSTPIDSVSLNKLKILRKHMYELLSKLKDSDTKVTYLLDEINKVMKNIEKREQLELRNGKFVLVSKYKKNEWETVIWQAAESFADMICNYDKTRIKICDNDECGWVFYDETKNKSQRWCDSKCCGNVMKVRNFRARRKIINKE